VSDLDLEQLILALTLYGGVIPFRDETIQCLRELQTRRASVQPAAIPSCPHPDVTVIEVAGKLVCTCCGVEVRRVGHHDRADTFVTADQQSASMQDAPQPVDGTGKQSMQACTNEKQTLVQPCQHDWNAYAIRRGKVAKAVCSKCGAVRDTTADKS
jgi:hypothetical protein